MGDLTRQLQDLDDRVTAARERRSEARAAARPGPRAERLEQVVGKLSNPWKGQGKYGRITAQDLADPAKREEVRRLGRGVAQRLLHEPDLVLLPQDPQRPQRGLVIHSTDPDHELQAAESELRDAQCARDEFARGHAEELERERAEEERAAFREAVEAGDVEAVREVIQA